MSDKYKNKKTSCSENKTILSIPNEIIAGITNTSVSMVKQVRNGNKSGKGKKGQQIKLVETLITQGSNALIEEVKRVVKL